MPQKSLLFTYSGDLNINQCKYITWDKRVHYSQIININMFSWESIGNTWNKESQKPEEIKKKFYNKVIRKSII